MKSKKKSQKILIIKNKTHEGPGIFEIVLKEKKIPYQVVDLDRGEEFPAPENYAGVVVLGGPDSANDQTPKMVREIERIRQCLKNEIPYFGICLGLQTLVKAAGGLVIKSPVKEIGFRGPDGDYFQVELSSEAMKDPLFEGIPNPLKVFHLHGETVQLTPSMQLAGKGKFCANQIVKIGTNAYGFQCHLELTKEMLGSWIEKDPDLAKLDAQTIKRDFESLAEYSKTGQRLAANFLNLVQAGSKLTSSLR